ncbi:DDE-type integrase/transposase/recombinase [Suicoccus acidiformans]|uniref:DDE-type integrase/transposase/recombinase n=1 Tax=Suicoccus acidiformans TaxID=2036206 RepID=UPI0013C32173|nr:DDE-type integrase/transposase/recombinase [Suicoccus acidiformans]
MRRPRKNRQIAKEVQGGSIKENLVSRQFKAYGPRIILLTDISYLPYGDRKFAYLSSVSDAYTNKILAYQVSDSLEIDFILETIQCLVNEHGVSLSTETIIHSDQGSHYTGIKFQELLQSKELLQSMSRRGYCWDNAPKESFLGHMKDEIDFYNNDRYQTNLAGLPPKRYYQLYLTGQYPYEGLIETSKIKRVSMTENMSNAFE